MGRALGFLFILFVGIVIGWLLAGGSTFGISGLPSLDSLLKSNTGDAVNNVTTSTSTFRFVLREDRIYYQDNVIDRERFSALINEAQQQDAVVVLEYDSTVTGKFVEDLTRLLNDANVKYVGIG